MKLLSALNNKDTHTDLHMMDMKLQSVTLSCSCFGPDVCPDVHHQETTGGPSCFPSPHLPGIPRGRWVRDTYFSSKSCGVCCFQRSRSVAQFPVAVTTAQNIIPWLFSLLLCCYWHTSGPCVFSVSYCVNKLVTVCICVVFCLREHVRVEVVLKVMSRVQMKSYYREAITMVRADTTPRIHIHTFTQPPKGPLSPKHNVYSRCKGMLKYICFLIL